MKTTSLLISTPQGPSGSVLSGAEDYIFSLSPRCLSSSSRQPVNARSPR